MFPQLKRDHIRLTNRLTDFLRDEVLKAGFSKVVIGLSGGVDSALSAYLATAAFGADNVLCVLMPYRESSSESITHAELVVSILGVRSETIEITSMVEPLFAFDTDMNLVRKGNIMARQRMIILYDRSSRERALVVGTGNKTELLLGYSTLYGDSASAVNPLGDLYKSQVWQLARHLGVPEVIIKKAPSADLWVGQTDENELGFSYRRVDELLCFMVDEGKSDDALVELGFERSFAENVRSRIERNEFKRRTPIIATVDD